jgi:hypothetical protein
MTADEFIKDAIDRGASVPLADLSPIERFVFLISEAEVYCDMEGIDSLLDRYSAAELGEYARAFAEVGASAIAAGLAAVVSGLPGCDEKMLDHVNRLITDREGYGYEGIRDAVARRLSSSYGLKDSTKM